MKIRLPFLFFTLLCLSGFSQQEKEKAIADLQSKINATSDDTLKAYYHLQICKEYYEYNYNEELKHARLALKLSSGKKNKLQLPNAYYYLGESHLQLGNTDSALFYLNKEVGLRIKIKDEENLSYNYRKQGNVYYVKGQFAKAIKKYIEASRYWESVNNYWQQANLLVDIGNLYYVQKNYKESVKNYEKASEYFFREKDTLSALLLRSNIGSVYMENRQYNQAIEVYRNCINVLNKSKDLSPELPHVVYCNLSMIYSETKQFDSSRIYFEKATKVFNSVNSPPSMRPNQAFTSIMYYVGVGEYAKALKFADEVETLALQMQSPDILSKTYNLIMTTYKGMGNYKKAMDYLDLYLAAKDTLTSLEQTRIAAELDVKYQSSKKDLENKTLKSEAKAKDVDLKNTELKNQKQKTIITAIIIGLVLTVLLIVLALRSIRSKNIANKLILEQKSQLEEKQKEITDSINYARRIQYSLLANAELLKENLEEYSILFKPKDIVSGDFYWCTKKGNNFYLAVCDCTGHGVPGAFMSLLNISFLNEAVTEKNILEPHEILNHVRKRLIDNIEGAQDGMDAILVRFNGDQIQYAGAYNRPVLISKSQIIDQPTDKMPVGKGIKNESFTLHTLDAKKGDYLFLFTDGFADQFGGEKGKKFKDSALKELLLEIASRPGISLNDAVEPMDVILNRKIEGWKGELEQVDDICIIGIKI